MERTRRDEFRQKLKEEWKLLWKERFDDKFRAEGIAIRDYPLLFMDRGFVIFASRLPNIPSFSDILEYWASQGSIYAPDHAVGGWGKFAKTFLTKRSERRKALEQAKHSNRKRGKQQLKKGGRGWLHVE